MREIALALVTVLGGLAAVARADCYNQSPGTAVVQTGPYDGAYHWYDEHWWHGRWFPAGSYRWCPERRRWHLLGSGYCNGYALGW